MAGREIWSNFPIGPSSDAKVRGLQRRLWAAAKRSSGRRFHALYDRIYRDDVLWAAWKPIRANRGAAGIDRETLADVERYGVERLLGELQTVLRAGRYRPPAVRGRTIAKADGGRRPLGIPTVRDQIVQTASKMVLEPIFEADFLPCSYGFRPRRGATDALEALRRGAVRGGGNHVLDAGIRDFFGQIDHGRLLEAVARRLSDRRVLKLVRQWLRAGVLGEDGQMRHPTLGTPQGGVISPLLANLYLHALDAQWQREHAPLGRLVRYCDDFVVRCETAEACEEAERRVREICRGLGLELHPGKTRRVDLTEGREGFDFLGCHLRKRVSGRLLEQGVRKYYLQRWPSQRSMKRVQQRVKERTGRQRCGVKDIRVLIRELNPLLRGWGAYFRTGNAAKKFNQLDTYVWRRLHRFLVKRKGRNLRAGEAEAWDRNFFWGLGLYRLRGTVRYPGAAQCRDSRDRRSAVCGKTARPVGKGVLLVPYL